MEKKTYYQVQCRLSSGEWANVHLGKTNTIEKALEKRREREIQIPGRQYRILKATVTFNVVEY